MNYTVWTEKQRAALRRAFGPHPQAGGAAHDGEEQRGHDLALGQQRDNDVGRDEHKEAEPDSHPPHSGP